jgi:hypothetical protein
MLLTPCPSLLRIKPINKNLGVSLAKLGKRGREEASGVIQLLNVLGSPRHLPPRLPNKANRLRETDYL